MPSWNNWSGKLQARPDAIHFLRSAEDAAALALHADTTGQTVRVAGATHSHAPLVAHDGIIADCRGLAGVVSADPSNRTAWVRSGTRIHALGMGLHAHGMALPNQGDIDEQAISGATATGTHGTGRTLKNLSSAVIGMKLATASGDIVEVSEDQHTTLWQAGRLHLGALGIVIELELQLRDAYVLAEKTWQASLADVMAEADSLMHNHRHWEFFWYPQTDQAQVKVIDETTEPPVYPIASEGERRGWSHEVLPNHRPHKHTEMEYALPAAGGPDALRDIQALLASRFTDVRWPVEYRTVAADDVWLSPAYQRDSVTISVHQDIAEDDAPYFKACEEIFLHYGGRPHWGKVHYLNAQQLADQHPCWDAWWQARDSIDPNGTFLHPYLRSLRG